MAQTFKERPSAFYGLTEPEDAWLALLVDRVTFLWGATVERWQREQVQVPKPSRTPKQTMMDRPKYEPEEITRMIHGPLPTPNQNASVQGVALPSSRQPLDPLAVAGIESDDVDNIPPRWRNQNVDHLINNLPRGER